MTCTLPKKNNIRFSSQHAQNKKTTRHKPRYNISHDNYTPPSTRSHKENQLSRTTSGSVTMPALPAWSRRAATEGRICAITDSTWEFVTRCGRHPVRTSSPDFRYAGRLVLVARSRLTHDKCLNGGCDCSALSEEIHEDRRIRLRIFLDDVQLLSLLPHCIFLQEAQNTVHQPISILTSSMPAIPYHALPCTWLAPTALLMSFAAGIGFAAMKHRHFCSHLLIAQPTVEFLVRVALVVVEDNVSGLVNIHD